MASDECPLDERPTDAAAETQRGQKDRRDREREASGLRHAGLDNRVVGTLEGYCGERNSYGIAAGDS